MLQTKEDYKEESTVQYSRLFAREGQRPYKNAIEKPIVLKMNVVDYHQAWR